MSVESTLAAFASEYRSSSSGARRSETRAVGVSGRRLELAGALFHRVALLPQLRQRAAVFGDPLLVDSGERGNGAHRAREFTDAVHVKQQARIPAAAPFVDVDEPDFQIGKLRGALLVNYGQPLRRLLQRCLRPGDSGVGRRDLFGGDVALNFELAKITKDRARLRGETIRFCLQCANLLVDASRERIGRVAICALGVDGLEGRERREEQEQRNHRQEDTRDDVPVSPITPLPSSLPNHAPSIKSPGALRGA